jgi:hypothetical protein
MVFLGENELLLLEKNTGIVQHIVDGAVHHTALDLAVNFFSERGLLGIVLDPDFESNHFVYLYWSCLAPVPTDPFTPSQEECADAPEPGTDSEDLLQSPCLAIASTVSSGIPKPRCSPSTWFDQLRAFQNDMPEPPRSCDETQRHAENDGVMTFGQDGKLYIFIGDVGDAVVTNLPWTSPHLMEPQYQMKFG